MKNKIRKYFSITFVLVIMTIFLCGCKDDTYAGLYVTDNASDIYDICKVDVDFTSETAKDIATKMSEKDFKRIKNIDTYDGGTLKKVIITDANKMSFIIIIQDNKFQGVCTEDGSQFYVRTY